MVLKGRLKFLSLSPTCAQLRFTPVAFAYSFLDSEKQCGLSCLLPFCLTRIFQKITLGEEIEKRHSVGNQ